MVSMVQPLSIIYYSVVSKKKIKKIKKTIDFLKKKMYLYSVVRKYEPNIGDEMGFNFAKLRGRIREIYETEGKLAHDLGITHTCLGQKLNGKSAFRSTEITKIVGLLKIDSKDIPDYFFARMFVNTNQPEEGASQ
jgi:hypothetical protein